VVDGRPYAIDNFKSIYYPGSCFDKDKAQGIILKLIDQKIHDRKKTKK
jgi:hypothetical protein